MSGRMQHDEARTAPRMPPAVSQLDLRSFPELVVLSDISADPIGLLFFFLLRSVVGTDASGEFGMDITSSRATLRGAELASRLGCNLETIRYYEKIGLLREPDRSARGHRLYSGADQARLRFILQARGLGFTVGDVRSLLGLNDGMSSCASIKTLAARHQHNIRARIVALQFLEQRLEDILEECTGDETSDCALINHLLDESRPGSCPT